MKKGHLSEYFSGVAVKRLSAVEADAFRSHQHEFNGVEALKRLFGEPQGKTQLTAKFLYLCDNDDEPITCDGSLTWYDARERHPTRSEYRLYFRSNAATDCATAGDLLVLGKRSNGDVLVVIAENDTTIASQVQWLFGVTDLSHPGFSIREELETDRDRVALTSRTILESIGIEVESEPDSHLDDMLSKFEGSFPPTRTFSKYARDSVSGIGPKDDPDAALTAWMDREEILFRTLERHFIGNYLSTSRVSVNRVSDVESFLSYSKSVQNRRKSRAGYALENHLEEIFLQLGIRYTRQPTTENNSKPDYLFPGVAQYHDCNFNPEHLTMLGVKSTCKDRWRQVLAEADRIPRKHLLTMEAAISANQTSEMQAKNLQLIVPRALHDTYQPLQRSWLWSVQDFTSFLLDRQ